MANEAKGTEATAPAGNGAEAFTAGLERVGESGLVLRMQFPSEKVREDFLVAFKGWQKEYKQQVVTAHLVQALVAEKVGAAQAAAEEGDDTGGFWLWAAPLIALDVALLAQNTRPQTVLRGPSNIVFPQPRPYSDWMPW